MLKKGNFQLFQQQNFQKDGKNHDLFPSLRMRLCWLMWEFGKNTGKKNKKTMLSRGEFTSVGLSGVAVSFLSLDM